MDLKEIKEWRETSTLKEAQVTFISRLDFLISECERLGEENERLKEDNAKYADLSQKLYDIGYNRGWNDKLISAI